FLPAANASGTPYSSFTFQVKDDGLTANGGVDLDPSAKSIVVNVNSVNDAPVGAGRTIGLQLSTGGSTPVSSNYTFVASDFGFTDPRDNPANAFLAVKITTLPTSGTLNLGSTAVAAGATIPALSLSSLVYTAPTTGTSASFTF